MSQHLAEFLIEAAKAANIGNQNLFSDCATSRFRLCGKSASSQRLVSKSII
jgi:hypothetical protein